MAATGKRSDEGAVEEALSLKQLSRTVGGHRSSWSRAVKRRDLKATRNVGRVVVTESELLAFIRARRHGPAGAQLTDRRQLVTEDEAAARLDRTVRTIGRLRAAGALPWYEVHRHVLLHIDDVDTCRSTPAIGAAVGDTDRR